MDPAIWHAVAEGGLVIGMSLVGFICGLMVNVERIARIARWKAELEDESCAKDRSIIVKF